MFPVPLVGRYNGSLFLVLDRSKYLGFVEKEAQLLHEGIHTLF